MKLHTFKERYLASRERKQSILCVGLDPAIPKQRSINVISEKYFEHSDEMKHDYIFVLT